MHLVNGTGNSPSLGQPTPGVVKQDKSSGGSVDTTKTHSGPQRVRMSSGKRPIGAAKGKQSDTEALCQPPRRANLCSSSQVGGSTIHHLHRPVVPARCRSHLRPANGASPANPPPLPGGGGGWHKALVVGSVSLWRGGACLFQNGGCLLLMGPPPPWGVGAGPRVGGWC